jgi:hypothetical protein
MIYRPICRSRNPSVVQRQCLFVIDKRRVSGHRVGINCRNSPCEGVFPYFSCEVFD